MWYNPRITLSYNCLFNFVMGARSAGKTFNSILYAIEKRNKSDKPYEIAYVRRYNTELKECRTGFFNALKAEGKLDGHETKINGNTGNIDKQPFVHFYCLSKSGTYKSVEHPYIKLIIFDEFIIDKGHIHYLPNEVDTFFELYVTIARGRDIPVLFLANSISQTNPYFAFFNIVPNGNEFLRNGEWLLHTFKDVEQIEGRKNSRFGKLIAGSNYAKYSIENEYLRDNSNFVEPKEASAKPFYSFVWEGKEYTVWQDFNKGKMWVCAGKAKNMNIVYTFTKENQTPNQLLAKGFKTAQHFKITSQAMSFGSLFYDSIETKNQWFNLSRMVINL